MEFLIPKYAQEGKNKSCHCHWMYRRQAPFCYHCKRVVQPGLPEMGIWFPSGAQRCG